MGRCWPDYLTAVGDLSPHFSRWELRSPDGAALPELETLYQLVAHLEVLRCLAGHRPLRIVSGHRSRVHNAAVGGAPLSRHVSGDAADLELGAVTMSQAVAAGFRGIGTKRGVPTHVDLRPERARWTYD